MKRHKETIFLTGATGLVGSYLVKDLLKKGHKVYVLARSKDGKSARKRVADIVKFWDKRVFNKNYRRLFVLEGDITKKNLGLKKKQLDSLKRNIEIIYHSAASTKFNLPLSEIRKINVEGTKNVLDLALVCKKTGKLKKVNHISTAYVCGDYKGVFTENDLDVGQGFNTTYEQSKFEAEKLVEKYRKKGLWIDVFRPPLVIGESSTGKTSNFQQGFYQLVHLWKQEVFDLFPIKDLHVKMIFVDDLCKSIELISTRIKSENKNYHMFSRESVFLASIMNVLAKILKIKEPKIVSRKEFNKNNHTFIQKKLLDGNILAYNEKVMFSSISTSKTLNGNKFKFSNFDSIKFDKLLKYLSKNKFIRKL